MILVSRYLQLESLGTAKIYATKPKEDVFNYTGKKIDSYGTVNIIVSSSFKKHDGTILMTDDIMPNATFYYTPMTSATLVFRETGMYYVLSEDQNPLLYTGQK